MKLTIPLPETPSSPLYFHILFLLLIFITACSVLKERALLETDSLQKKNIRRETKTQKKIRVDAMRVYNHQDSSDSQSFTEIFPQGLFNFSAKEGFTGIAKRVVINERLKAGTKVSDFGKISAMNNTVSASSEKERLLSRNRLKEKTVDVRDYNLWYLGGLLLIFTAVFIFRSKLND